jgi:predicted O-methyltransferase YrrM
MITLPEYYESLGYPRGRWHIGNEHPHLEEHAIRLLREMPRARVLEVGYQAGGFAVPVILAMQHRPDFAYVGMDSLAYETAVEAQVIAQYLRQQGVRDCYKFVAGDAGAFLARLPEQQFDLVLIDHYKPLYPRELRTLVRRGLVSPEGCILFHDVLGKARDVWQDCIVIGRAYGYAFSIVREVPEGLAVVRRDRSAPSLTVGEHLRLPVVHSKIFLRQVRERIRRAGTSTPGAPPGR